jgi:adenosine deaminase
VIVNTVSLSKKKAMGWYGVDESTQHYWGNKLRVLDVSQWYYHHSALINASDAVSDNIYRDIIFDPVQGITL